MHVPVLFFLQFVLKDSGAFQLICRRFIHVKVLQDYNSAVKISNCFNNYHLHWFSLKYGINL